MPRRIELFSGPLRRCSTLTSRRKDLAVPRQRSPWGSVRRLPSGRYQARYRLEGTEYLAPDSFPTRRQADAYLAALRADIERGAWVDPDAGRITLADYASQWLKERTSLRPRTRELYESELRLHIVPALGTFEIVATFLAGASR